jgi:NAD dependent epimerase/dehydratase family enzyme
MAQDLLLDGVRVKPGVLESTGFGFLAEDIAAGLQQAVR